MPARIELSKFCHEFGSKFDRMIGQSSAANIVTSISILTHDRTMRFFNNKPAEKWQKDVIKHQSSGLPSENWAVKGFFTCPSVALLSSSTKCFFKPIYKYFIARCDLKHAMPAIIAAIFMLFGFSYIKTAFSIYNTGKISPLFWCLIGVINYFFSHNDPFIYNSIVLNEKDFHAERLNKKTRKGCDSLNSSGNLERMGRRACSATQVVTKVTEMVLNETAELLGLSMRMTEDQLTRDMLAATASVYYCTGGNNGDNPTNLSLSDIDTVTAQLLSNDAWMVLNSIGGEDKFGTGPVRDAYLALGHTDLVPNLNNLNGFISKYNYPNQNRTLASEWGTVNNTRFMVSSVGSISPLASGLGNNIYNVFVQGMEALACVEQDNYSAQFLYRPPVFSDPLFQNVTVGYVFAEVPRILNDLWITNMRCTLAT